MLLSNRYLVLKTPNKSAAYCEQKYALHNDYIHHFA